MLEILYRDEHLVIINKPSGLLVHKSPIDKNETEFALQLLRDQIGQYVYPVHRLDKPTSGVLMFALSSEVAKLLSEDFRENRIKKEYMAVVRGYTEYEELIDYDLKVILDKKADKDRRYDKEPQSAQTYYEQLKTMELPYAVSRYPVARYSLVKLFPKTGRKHQLRRNIFYIQLWAIQSMGEQNIIISFAKSLIVIVYYYMPVKSLLHIRLLKNIF
jgi:tRNA pseudouridine65 synthase